MLERLKRYIQNPVFLFILWMAVALVCSLMLIPKETYSNYITFSQAFWHRYLPFLCTFIILKNKGIFFCMVSLLQH